MPRQFFRRHLPSPSSLREHSTLRPLGSLLHNPQIWHLHRRSVSGAVFIGLFCAFLPVPFQMFIAAALAIGTRCNLPIAVVLVWITNPVTFAPMFYFAYKLGAWLLGMELTGTTENMDYSWLASQAAQVWKPLLLGSLVCGWVLGTTGFVVTRVIWRWRVIRHWQERRERRRQARQQVDQILTSEQSASPAPEASTDPGNSGIPQSNDGIDPGSTSSRAQG